MQDAANAQQSIGIKPTARMFRQLLGGVGSMGTITKHLQQWRAAQEAEPASLRMLPPALQQAFLAFCDSEAAKLRRQIASNLVDANRELSDLAEDNERQAETIALQYAEIEQLTADAARLDGRLAQQSMEMSALREQMDAERREREQALGELTNVRSRLDGLATVQTALEQAKQELASQGQAGARAETDKAVLAFHNTKLEARQGELKNELAEARARNHELEKNFSRLLTTLQNDGAARTDTGKEAASQGDRAPRKAGVVKLDSNGKEDSRQQPLLE